MKMIVFFRHGRGCSRAATLGQAQGDSCHGEPVEPWIPASAGMTVDYVLGGRG